MLIQNQTEKEKILPSIFTEAVYLLDGRPFRLKNRSYLKAIYDWDIHYMILKTGRQVEKSTTLSTKIANDTTLIPFNKCMYIAPSLEQVKMFSNDRLGRLYEYSQNDILMRKYVDRKSQNVFNKTFTNGSLNYFKACYDNGDNIRGYSVNTQCIDEIQDINVDALPVVQECTAHAYDLGPGFKKIYYAGTPKTFSNTIQFMWDKSNCCEWVIKCPHCGTLQILGEKNLRPDKYVCRKCEGELDRYTIDCGQWVKTKTPTEFIGKNGEHELWGFRITQMMCPAVYPSEVWNKYLNYPRAQFCNEVLGMSYENAEKPFTATLLSMICDNDLHMLNGAEDIFANRPLFAGIDWGEDKSPTVITIGGRTPEGRIQIVYTHQFAQGNELDRTYQKQQILRLLSAYRVAYCICDYGNGYADFRDIRKMLGNRIDCCFYSDGAGQKHKYNNVKNMWVVNRTECLQEYVEAMHAMEFIWPGADRAQFPYMFEHHLAVQVEYRAAKSKINTNIVMTSSEKMYYSHPMGTHDDSFHSCHYMYLALTRYEKKGGTPTSPSINFYTAYSR